MKYLFCIFIAFLLMPTCIALADIPTGQTGLINISFQQGDTEKKTSVKVTELYSIFKKHPLPNNIKYSYYKLDVWIFAALQKLEIPFKVHSKNEDNLFKTTVIEIDGQKNNEHCTWNYYVNGYKSPYHISTQLDIGIEKVAYKYECIEPDYFKIGEELRVSAENGSVEASEELKAHAEICHRDSKISEEESSSCMISAAGEHPDSQATVGAFYHSGNYVEKDLTEASKWYLLSAEQGAIKGLMMMGNMYTGGLGVQKDNIEAYAWYSLVIKQRPKNKYESRFKMITRIALASVSMNLTTEERKLAIKKAASYEEKIKTHKQQK